MGVGNAPAVVFLLLALSAVELEFHSMKLLDIFLPRVRNGNSEFRNLPEQEKKILYINSTIQM
jgi:hypothetical protein